MRLDTLVPSFLSGVARTLDIGSTYTEYNFLDDTNALLSDLAAVGHDFGNQDLFTKEDKKE